MAKKKSLFQPKGTLFTYEDWKPSGNNPFETRQYSQDELVNEYKKIYSQTDLPVILSRYADSFPQNPDIALSLAKSGTSGDATGAAARLQTILNESMADKAWEGTGGQVNNIDYNEYLKGLNKDEDTATEQDKDDAAWFAAIKRTSRTFLTPLFSGYEAATNVFRQIDGYANQNETGVTSLTDPDNVIVAGEDASDFTRIYKNTTLYQNTVEGLGVGTGFIPSGEAYQAKEALSSRVARVRSAKTGQEYFYTPGRAAISALTTLDPEDSQYKIISGIIDGVLGFYIDPAGKIGRVAEARKALTQAKNLREATSAAGTARATADVAEEIASYRANLPSREALEALENQKVAAAELDEVYAKIAEQRNILNDAITQGTVAEQPKAVQAAIRRSGLTQLNETKTSLLEKIKDQDVLATGVVLDPATGTPMSKADSLKYLKEEIKSVDDQINTALDGIYITRFKKVRDTLELKKSGLQQATDNLAQKYKEVQEIGTPEAKQRFIMEERAGLLQASDGYKVNKEKAIEWIFGKNADVVLQRIAETESAAQIMRLSKNNFDANLAKELAAAKTVDDVEVLLLGRIGVDVNTSMPRTAIGRYVVNSNPNFIMKPKSSVQNLTKYGQALKFLGTRMPTQTSIKLDDTNALVEEVRRWMIGARYNVDDIDRVIDEIIDIDELDFTNRQNVITRMLDDTVDVYAKQQKISPKIKEKLVNFTTAYRTASSGAKEYTSQVIGDEVGNKIIIDGQKFDLTDKPTSITQLATEIALPNVYAVRELTGIMARATRSVDNVIAKDSRMTERATFAATRFTRSATDGFLRSVLLVGRISYEIRNIAEMQTRMFLAGGIGLFTNPVKFTALIMSNPDSARAIVRKAAAKDPYTVDINGKAFVGAERFVADDTQAMHDSFANTMASRGHSLEGQNMDAAWRSGEYNLIKLDISKNGTPRNAKEYAEAVASRLLQHRADPIKRAVATNDMRALPKGLADAVKEGRMTYQEALIQAIRDGQFQRQIDILGNAEPQLQKLFSMDNGIRTLLFGNTSRSYAREIADETLGMTELREFITSGKIVERKEVLVDGVPTIKERVVFEMGNSYKDNHRGLSKIIRDQLLVDDVAKTNASNLFMPHEKSIELTDVKGKYNQFADWFFRQAARAEVRTVYGPEYRIAYWEAVSEMAPIMSREAAQKVLKNAEDIKRTRVATEGEDGVIVYQSWTELNPAFDDIVQASKDGVGRLTVKDVDAYARDKAAKRIASLFYDATQKNNLTYAAQLVLPFVNAWANTIRKWSELGTNPSRLATRVAPATRLYQNLLSEETSAIYDFTGTPHDPMQGFVWNNQYGDKVFTLPLSGYLRTLFGLRGNPETADVAIPLKSLNLAFSGAELADSDLGILPGFGTVWNIAYGSLDNEIQNKTPDVLANMIAPYGTSEGKYIGFLPAWIQKIAAAIVEDEKAYGKTAKPIMAWEATTNPKYKVLYDGTPLTPEDRAVLQADLAAYGLSRARFAYLMQGLLQNVLPGTPLYEYYAQNENGDTFLQWQMADSFNKIVQQHDGNFETAWAEYTAVWGRNAVLIGFSDNKNQVFANDEAWNFGKNNPSLFSSYGDVIPYFFTGGDFSSEYRKAMERRGKGDRLTAEEVLKEADRLSMSAMRGQLAIEAVYGGFDANWIDDQMKAYKSDVLQGYEPEVTINIGARDQKIMRIESALKKPEFANTDAGQAALLYFAERDRWLEQSRLYYPDRDKPSLSGQDNAEARYRLRVMAEQLSANNDDFKNMFIRVLAQELKEED